MIYRVTTLEVALAASTSSPATEWLWPVPGFVLGVWLGTSTGAVARRATLGLAIQRRSRELVSNDAGRAFLCACGAGGAEDYAGDWMDLLCPVEGSEIWIVQLRNEDAAVAVTPRLMFDFVPAGPLQPVR